MRKGNKNYPTRPGFELEAGFKKTKIIVSWNCYFNIKVSGAIKFKMMLQV